MDSILTYAGLLLSTLIVGMTLFLRDKSLIQSKALPNGAASTVTDGIDLKGGGTDTDHITAVDFELTIPSLTTSELADTQTITYTVETSDTSSFGSVTTVYTLATQTGAGGAGATGSTRRFALPSNCQRYMRVKATKTGASNASTSSMTVTPQF